VLAISRYPWETSEMMKKEWCLVTCSVVDVIVLRAYASDFDMSGVDDRVFSLK
jgi:hypothetical protein